MKFASLLQRNDANSHFYCYHITSKHEAFDSITCNFYHIRHKWLNYNEWVKVLIIYVHTNFFKLKSIFCLKCKKMLSINIEIKLIRGIYWALLFLG